MKVKELIKILKKINPEHTIWIEDLERGPGMLSENDIKVEFDGLHLGWERWKSKNVVRK